MTVLPNAWLRVLVTRENARRRVVCFPHSGGGPSVFTGWESLAGDIEVVAINPPGRNDRSSEKPINDWSVAVREICDALCGSGALALPYVFFGHSLGALLAYEVALLLKSRHELQPLHIFASSSESPSALSHRDIATPIHTLPDDDFLEAVSKWDVLPPELSDSGLRAAVLPSLRADITMFEKYPGNTALLHDSTTVSILVGKQDTSITETCAQTWAASTNASQPTVTYFEGGHFYFSSAEGLASLLSHVDAVFNTRMASAPLSIHYGGDAPHLHEQKCVWELVADCAKAQPHSLALVDEARGDLTYSEMWKLSLIIAKQVSLSGKKGATVGMMLPHSSDYVCAMLGIWVAGGCFLVLERHHPPQMLHNVCATCNPDGSGKPDVIITRSEFLSSFTEKLADVPKILLDDGWEHKMDYSGFNPEPGNLNDRAILMTTSGTSGMPKLIEGTQRFQQVGMLSRTTLMPYTGTPFTPNADREACSVMFVWEAPRSIITGHVCVIIPETVIIDPIKLVEFLIKNKCTRILTTPSLANHVFDYVGSDLKVANSLQQNLCRWFFMGEVCTAKLVAQALRVVPKIKVINAYSTWEAADTTLLEGSAEYLKPYKKFYPVGTLHEGVIAVVVDPQTRKPVPRNVPGELFTTGPQLATGYANAPQLTAERYIPLDIEHPAVKGGEKWYKSGDLAVMFDDGKIELHGRIDSTVKIRGFKVGLPFVEGVLLDTVNVAVAVVVPTFDRESNQPDALAALLLPAEAHTGTFGDFVTTIKKGIASKMPKWATPTFFLHIEDIIEGDLRQGGESKKINRRAIPKLFTKELKERFKVKSAGPKVMKEGVEGVIYKIWVEVLDLDDSFDPADNFFELGGHSLLASTMTQKLTTATHVEITVLDLYENSTLDALVKFVKSSSNPIAMRPTHKKAAASGKVAIIGMAGRFPGADNIYQFWDNLKAGNVSPTFFTNEQLAAKGVGQEVINHPDFVKVAYMVNNADKFDAKFFGIGRTEASTMDPQHRLFIEASWNAIEHAGYAPKTGFETENTRVGVFGSAGIDGYLIHHLNGGALRKPLEPGNLFMTEVASEKDYIATRVSYLLNLRGPAMNVNSACSSALVAVSQACTSIVMGECDMAVAGGCALNFPNIGFLYQDGLIYSKDGYVRPLDEAAEGTAFGDAVGAVVLKRLEDAEADGDHIWGVVQGFGVSNDGNVKAGYAAPAAAGQADCVSKAMAMNDTKPEDVSYVEMHATGTLVGDGIEAKGLTTAWRSHGLTDTNNKWCALGSVKGNIGHANCAAGITGLIKTMLMLKYKQLVPTANFKNLNDKVKLNDTPFYVNTETRSWEPANGVRCAGVSSFGIGGTNAHLVISEYVKEEVRPAHKGGCVSLQFSAKSAESLEGTVASFAEYATSGHSTESLIDIAHTLRTGREQFMVRSAVTVPVDCTKAELKQLLQSAPSIKAGRSPAVAFLCPGQGSQYLGMAKGLCTLPTFKKHFDECCERLAPLLGVDLRETLFGNDAAAFSDPLILQPSLFTVEYSVARLLMAMGVVPNAVAGHSIGEYVASVIGNHITLDSALRIVATRALATSNDVQQGAMLSVGMGEEAVRAIMEKSKGAGSLWLAAQNSPVHSVVSGTVEAVDILLSEISEQLKEVKVAKLHVNRAFHSELMKPAGDKLLEMTFEKPEGEEIPCTSNVTGAWADADIRTGRYWKRHMEDTVRWRDCARTLLETTPYVCVEVGPGNTLSTLGNKCVEEGKPRPNFEQSMRHARSDADDVQVMATLLGRLWCNGVGVDWGAWNAELGLPSGSRVSLPGYSFEKTSFWVNPAASMYVDGPGQEAPAAATHTAPPVDTDMLVRFSKETADKPALRLYCLPFAGGSSRSFEKWHTYLSSHVDVVAVELPGRGGRAGDAHLQSDADDAKQVQSIAAAIEADMGDVPFVLVGKSMGGLIACEVAIALRENARKLLLGIAIAGRAPVRESWQIPDLHFTDETLSKYSLAPEELQQSEAWTSYLLPMLKSDLLSDTRAEKRLAKLSKPFLPETSLAVFCGSDDDIFKWEVADEWKEAVETNEAHVSFMPGGHDFLTNHTRRIAEAISKDALNWLIQSKTKELSQITSLKESIATPTTRPAPLYAVQWQRATTSPAAGTEKVPVAHSIFNLPSASDPDVLLALASRNLLVYLPSGTTHDEARTTGWLLIKFLQELSERGVSDGMALTLLLPKADIAGFIAGASKVVPFEIPELRIRRAYSSKDTSYEATHIHCATAVAAAVDDDLDIDEFRVPKVVKDVARLKLRKAVPATGLKFVVTGWTGGLGSEMLKWLVKDCGVRPENVVLLSRREVESPFGMNVVVCRNMCDAQELAKGLAAAVGDAQVGVLHLAGALDDGMISSQTAEKFDKTLQPKVGVLRAVCGGLKAVGRAPQWVLAFSSTSSLFGYPGQSNYCAANGYVDALTQWGSEDVGCKVTAVSWGPWGEVGMAQKGTKAYALAVKEGDTPLATLPALACLGHVLAMLIAGEETAAQYAVCDVEWGRSPWQDLPCLSLVAKGAKPAPVVARQEGEDQGFSAQLKAWLTSEVGRTSWDAVANEDMASLGLDSLDTVQLRNAFNKKFKKTAALTLFSKPNLTMKALHASLTE